VEGPGGRMHRENQKETAGWCFGGKGDNVQWYYNEGHGIGVWQCVWGTEPHRHGKGSVCCQPRKGGSSKARQIVRVSTGGHAPLAGIAVEDKAHNKGML